MSWSVKAKGTKEEVKAKLTEQFDAAEHLYSGQPEADDVRAVKERALALVDACTLEPQYGQDWNGVSVEANGSHANGNGFAGGSFQLSVFRVVL